MGEPLFAGDCYMNAPPLHLALLRGPSDFVPLCERILKSELTTALGIASWGSRYLPLHSAILAGAPAAVLERLVSWCTRLVLDALELALVALERAPALSLRPP